MKTAYRVLATAGALALAAPATAQSVGDRVTCTAVGFTCSAASATVGSGVEFAYGPATLRFIDLDFSANLLTITSRGSRIQFGATQSVALRDTTSAFTAATLQFNSGSTLTAGDIVLNNGLLTINLTGREIAANGRLEIALATAAAAAVPEPATWAMMLLGFGVVGAAVRRRQAVATRVRFA